MAYHGPDNFNGAQNGPIPSAQLPGHQARFSRPFTLQEALPFSPFTSVIPFESDIIPTPDLGAGPSSSNLADLVPVHDFENLNKEAGSPSSTSRRLEQTLEHVQNLLNPSRLTKINFKTGAIATASSNPSNSLATHLSPFSKMVLDRTAVPYRYPTPDSPGPAAASSSNSQHPTPQQPTKKAPKPVKQRRESAAVEQMKTNKDHETTKIETPERSETKFAVFIPTKKQYEAANSATANSNAPQASTFVQQLSPPTPVSTVIPTAVDAAPSRSPSQMAQSAQKAATISIELTPTPSFNKSEYMVVNAEVDEPSNLSMRKRKREDYDEGQNVYRDQKQKADNAFHSLRRCFLDIFDAEDNVAATQSGSNPLIFLNSQQEPAMTTAAHQKVQPLLQNAITLRSFAYVPVDELLRIQRLSDAALKQVQDQDIRIDEAWSGTDALPWAQQLLDVDNALRGARTVLRIMSAGREDKQLYSEDLIQDCLRLFRDVADGIIVPLTEKVRRYGISGEKTGKDSSKGLFDSLISHKKPVGSIFTSFTRLYSVFTTLISNIDLSESAVTALETISSNLIFTENASTDRDSVVGVQKFDGIRLVAMEMLSQIFLKNSQSRLGIVDDILLQLEKIPQAKQKARQFKLSDGRSIQPVSALILRLVQTSAGKVADVRSAQSKLLRTLDDGATSDGINEHSLNATKGSSFQDEDRAAEQAGRAIAELQRAATSLAGASRDTAAHVIGFMVGRAIKSTKTGESPFRRILENFLEDLTTCLESPDWPASELLLRLLMASMMSLVDGERTAAPAKNMALEILGTMGAAISKLRSHVRKTVNSLDSVETTDLGSYLSELAAAALEFNSRPEQIVSWSGPYRAGLEYLDQRCSEDPHLSSAVSFLVTDWANKVSSTYDAFQDDDDDERDKEFGRLAYRLRMMIEHRRWLSSEYSFAAVPSSMARLSYHIIVIRSQFCEAYRHLLNILLRFMTIDQATVRSKSLKSVNDVLETDPTILDGDSTVMQLIIQCSTDSSPQVRDSALGLIGKCIGMRPALEKGMIPSIIARFSDAGVGVRKRAMKLARDIYLRNFDRNDRSVIANGLLLRVQDPDEGVREVARQMIEEIWIAPYYTADNSATSKTALADHVALMIQTVTSGTVSNVLDKVFQAIIGSKEANFKVGQMLVASMFDLIDNPDSEDPTTPSGRDALQLLMILATADAKLFTFEQIKLLQPKVASIGSGNVDVSKAVMTIYRRVLPQLSKVYDQFLTEVRAALLPAIAKYPRSLLDDVAACLWIICGLLGSTEPLSRLLISVLRGMSGLREKQRNKALDDKGMNAFKAYALIAGMLGHHCDLDDKLDAYKQLFPTFKGNSVSRLIVELIIPFAQPSLPMDVRKAALDAAGLVCQAWPRNFAAANVYTTFQQVFDEEAAELEWMILRSLKGFLFTEERRSEQAASEATTQSEQGQKLNLKVMGGTTFDDVSSATTQRFLKDITRIALSSQNDHAFQAVEVLASINRQGLVHPKETGVTLITLETSSTSRISELAFSEHRALHDKHETVLEREYIKAVHSAFVYQRDIVGDYRGATTEPFTSKLHLMIEVLKSSKAKNRMKFFEKLCAQIDFEPAKLDSTGVMPDHVQFSQFIIENLAFFDYASVHELLHTVTTMEKLVTSTGASVAQAIEAEIFQVTMDAVSNSQAGMNGENGESGENGGPVFAPAAPPIDARRLRQLTAGSMILQSVWEARTYLRRQFNLGTNRRDGKLKTASKEKEAQKPVKVQTVTGDKFWDDVAVIMTALSSQGRMMEQCRSFVDLLNVDREFKVADEDDDEMNGEDPATPSGDEDDEEDLMADRGRKRKSTATPRKKRPRSSSQLRKRGRPRKNPQPRDDDEDIEFF
ncbi:Sister chromatid cohesion protein 2 [Gnomoniopsis smithogilvyi]|uniref:Sister chromatid cohesion protein n=1 Tax=Gnomoniopsis smithogilvyi TaxID=1191159 RepID=A0A9W9CVQ7_9PEZI|nr:Sister chromatid cohesion protein 2 [Gnomoniopsis smithogilvyi]